MRSDSFHLYDEENELIRERFDLSMERIAKIPEECAGTAQGAELRQSGGQSRGTVPDTYKPFFADMSEWLLLLKKAFAVVADGTFQNLPVQEKEEWNRKLYADILPDHYENSYANPAAAARLFGREIGRIFSVLAAELKGLIPWAFEGRAYPIAIACELFIEIYNYFEDFNEYTSKDAKRAIYYYAFDYSEEMLEQREREQLDPTLTFVRDLILTSDRKDPGYLYEYGCYISENEKKLAAYFASMSDDEVQAMADTWTDGYIRGFSVMGADFCRKSVIAIRYALGFERMVKAAVNNFEALGKKVVFFRLGDSLLTRKPGRKVGYFGTSANPQYDYDHRYDEAFVMNKAYLERKLASLKAAYETYKIEAEAYAGPCVLETFGEEEFVPEYKAEAVKPDKRQLAYLTEYQSQASRIAEEYIRSEQISYTIIAYPLPSIGERFDEIFAAARAVNNLNNETYQRIQQCIIDVLDQGDYCTVKGAHGNETDLKVMFYEITDPAKETVFENCTADVNIPAGEVFTSPKLRGTEGILHVSHVSLNGLPYQNLKISFRDGRIVDYSCENFEKPEDNRSYIFENVLHSHETLALGEFAIGTNTEAYAMGKRFGITDQLPILIAEKTGPHFAVGDTCYARSEDHRVYNPDGKEIAARENEVSALRNTDPEKAYYNCHTDITIPYHEIQEIAVHLKNGQTAAIIREGRFVLPGTEELNIPLDEVSKIRK